MSYDYLYHLKTKGLACDLLDLSPALALVIHQTLTPDKQDPTDYVGTICDFRDKGCPQTIYRLTSTGETFALEVYSGEPVVKEIKQIAAKSLLEAMIYLSILVYTVRN